MSENHSNVPYIVYESSQARAERTIKRLIAVTVLLIVLFTVTNGIWIWRELQFEDIEITQEAQADTGNALVNNGGDLNYGIEGKTNN